MLSGVLLDPGTVDLEEVSSWLNPILTDLPGCWGADAGPRLPSNEVNLGLELGAPASRTWLLLLHRTGVRLP